MAIRIPKREELRRLASKTLDAKFKTTIQEGLNCSPFEAEAVLDVVHEVYTPFLDAAAGTAPPGKVTLLAVSADGACSGCGKPLCGNVHSHLLS